MAGPSYLKRGLDSLRSSVGAYGVTNGVRRWMGIAYHRLSSDIDGQSIFEREWDICIILDACRADELERFTDEYEWLADVGRHPSVASCTWDWVPATVDRTPDERLRETTYVTANPFVQELTDQGTFELIDTVYEYAWDSDYGTVRPDAVTDRAVGCWRERDPERMVVHYIQPHVPFLTDDAESISKNNFDHDERSEFDAWDRVTAGQLDRSVAVERYRATLEQVLDAVDTFLSSVDADDVVVTADHGEAFGEMGLYGHPSHIDLPCLVEVPWVKTTASTDQEYEPTVERDMEASVGTKEQLEALGYSE